ncbi:hypothetical protein, partial [Nocardia brasiliensis]|uniref:hypothetical protein n=1 Tax=Nocardia brasiliensis TaxID=37326 RepID=UPI002458D7E2
MAEAWLRLAIDEMMYRPREPVIPDVTKLLDRAGLRVSRGISELASGYQHRIADMNKYTMYLNMRDADVYRRVAGMTTAAYETLRSMWDDIDELNDTLAAARFSALVSWIEILLVDRVVATLTEVQGKLRRLFDANKATAGGIDPGIADVTPPFVERIDPGVGGGGGGGGGGGARGGGGPRGWAGRCWGGGGG